MRRMRSDCCARAASGHVAAAPLINEMNSRRLIATPTITIKASYQSAWAIWKGAVVRHCAAAYACLEYVNVTMRKFALGDLASGVSKSSRDQSLRPEGRLVIHFGEHLHVTAAMSSDRQAKFCKPVT